MKYVVIGAIAVLVLFHVDSGIWGPYFLSGAATTVIAAGVGLGGARGRS